MPIAWDNESIGTQRTALQDFSPGLDYTTRMAFDAAWADNPAVRMYQWGGNLLHNDGEKLDAASISGLIKDAGLTNYSLPGGQYSKDTAMTLIERARQSQIAADVDARTDYGWGTPVRALARIGATLADPLNTAAMFVPGLGEAWAAERIAAGASRFVTRAAQGVTQGAAGMAALEALNYPLAQALHDDYTSSNSLMNILTGAGIGGAVRGLGALLERGHVPVSTKPRPGDAPDIGWRPETIDEVPLHAQAVLRTEMDAIVQRELGYLNVRGTADRTVVPGQATAEAGVSYPGRGAPGEVVLPGQEKTVRTPYAGEFWSGRPVEGGQLTENEARAAYVRWTEGETLSPRERAFVDYLEREAKQRMEGFESTVNTLRAGEREVTRDEYEAAGRASVAQMANDQPVSVDSIAPPSKRLTGPRSAEPQPGEPAKAAPMSADDIAQAINEQRTAAMDDVREAMRANRERSIFDGDGQPPRTEATPAAGNAADELTARVQDAQARATEAQAQADAAVQALQDQGFTAKAADLSAADEAIAQAKREAAAYKAVANCLEAQ